MADPLRPQFWVLRQNGAIVPLIAMDELPHNIRVDGVPRALNLKDTVGMVNIGEHPSRHRYHHVYDVNKTTTAGSKHTLPPIEIKSDEESMSSSSTKFETYSRSKKAFGIGEQPPSNDKQAGTFETYSGSTKASGIGDQLPSDGRQAGGATPTEAYEQFAKLPTWKDTTTLGSRLPAPGKKKYCSHWMSTGECDYAQQGCLYKHEMPFDLELLNHLGYQDIPKWYREKFGIGKLTATPGSGAFVSGPTMKSAAVRGTWRAGIATRGSKRPPAGPKSQRLPQGTKVYTGNQPPTESSNNIGNVQRQGDGASRHNNNPLYESRFADAPPAPPRYKIMPRAPQTQPAITTRQFVPHSRRSSLFSDPEADIIRENEQRKREKEEEYERFVAAQKRKIGDHLSARQNDVTVTVAEMD